MQQQRERDIDTEIQRKRDRYEEEGGLTATRSPMDTSPTRFTPLLIVYIHYMRHVYIHMYTYTC